MSEERESSDGEGRVALRTQCPICGGAGFVLRLYPVVGRDGRFVRAQQTPRQCRYCDDGWLDGLQPPV